MFQNPYKRLTACVCVCGCALSWTKYIKHTVQINRTYSVLVPTSSMQQFLFDTVQMFSVFTYIAIFRAFVVCHSIRWPIYLGAKNKKQIQWQKIQHKKTSKCQHDSQTLNHLSLRIFESDLNALVLLHVLCVCVWMGSMPISVKSLAAYAYIYMHTDSIPILRTV